MKTKWLNFSNEERQKFRYEKILGESLDVKLKKIIEDKPVVNFSFVSDIFTVDLNGTSILLRAENFEQEQTISKIRRFQDNTIIKINLIDSTYIHFGIFIFYQKLFFSAENPLIFSLPEKYKIKMRSIVPNENKMIKFLKDTFIFGEDKCFFRYFNKQENPDELNGTLFGEGYSCTINFNKAMQQVDIVELNKRTPNQNVYGSITLISGKFDFVDGIKKLTDSAVKSYESESQENKEFENIWLTYNKAMISVAREEVQRVGFVKYDGVYYNPLRLKIVTNYSTYNNSEFLSSNLGYAVCSEKSFEDAKKCKRNLWYKCPICRYCRKH